jgi:flagella basal body P-ring formation protein FlgA
LLVKTKGVALEDGYLGKKMKVKSKGSKKFLEGSLISPTEVEVKLK